MFSLLHFHFEATLRALSLTNPDLAAAVREVANSRQYLLASPEERLALFDKKTAELSRQHLIYTRETLSLVVEDMLAELAAQKVEHVDLRLPPNNTKWLGMNSFTDVADLFRDAQKVHAGLSVAFVGAVNLTCPEADIKATFDYMQRDRGVYRYLSALDINMLPEDVPKLAKFAPALKKYQSQGFGINIHLGELFANDVSETILQLIMPNRIGHGVLLLDSPHLVEVLLNNQVCLDMCPMSNTRLGVIDWAKQNPAKLALATGLAVSINTDDPKLFNSTIQDDLELTQLTDDECRQVIDYSRQHRYDSKL